MFSRHATLLTATLLLASGHASAQILFAANGAVSGSATKGQSVYAESCISCHGPKLEGSPFAPTLIGETFMSHWRGKEAAELLTQMRTTMPPKGLPTLNADVYPDLMAFLVKANLQGPAAFAGVQPAAQSAVAENATKPAAVSADLAQKLAALEACGPGRTAPHATWLGAFWEECDAEVAARRWGAPPLVRALKACAALAVLPPEPWMTLLWSQTAYALSTRAMRFHELPALLLACAEVGARPPDAWAEAMFDAALLAADGGAMSAAQTADLLSAVKRLRLAPPKGWAVKMLRHDAGAVAAR